MFEDMLAVLVGERIEVRVPHRRNISRRNTAPMFLTSTSILGVVREKPQEMQRLNDAMLERFTMRVWSNPIPMEDRVANFPRCGRCSAVFYLRFSSAG